MLLEILLFVIFVGLLIGIKWLFTPYTNWKNQQKTVKKDDSIVVICDGKEFKYSTYKNTSDVQLSIIIPSYNEENRLGRTLEATFKHFNEYKYEIIIINDASKDKTLEIAKKYQINNQNFKIITYNRNRGKGGAVRLGMLAAVGEIQLMMDADLATDLNEYEKLSKELIKITQNGLGLVAGSRNHLVKDVVVQRKWYRNILMHCSNFIINTICGVRLKDTQCGFKLFTRNTSAILFRVLHLERWAFDVELFMIAQKYKVPVSELPVKWEDVEGSHLNVVEASIQMARDFLLVRILYLLNIWNFKDDIGL
ncbi:unnamed protein product [Paramecium pentaurelia]|uniref:dolichyl-phosphate beta-glucosyltransferase n=1 Tax=Paramecium pentaurelia TaxID=43138 RepID=A0A8S1SAJ5_9CILI|nr:unnamed protein product [Paramecium pentaurelia]